MPRQTEIQSFAHPKLKEIYEFLAEHNISYKDASVRLGYGSAGGLRHLLNSNKPNKTLRALELFDEWKDEIV